MKETIYTLNDLYCFFPDGTFDRGESHRIGTIIPFSCAAKTDEEAIEKYNDYLKKKEKVDDWWFKYPWSKEMLYRGTMWGNTYKRATFYEIHRMYNSCHSKKIHF